MFDFKTSKRFDKAAAKLMKANKGLAVSISAAMDTIRSNPLAGELKTGDLEGIRCLDFKYSGTNYELAYDLEEDQNGNIIVVLLLLVGTRENFYEELKRYIN